VPLLAPSELRSARKRRARLDVGEAAGGLLGGAARSYKLQHRVIERLDFTLHHEAVRPAFEAEGEDAS
jgi:hypothetical protein